MEPLDITSRFYDFQKIYTPATKKNSQAVIVVCDGVQYVCKQLSNPFPSTSIVQLHRGVSILEGRNDWQNIAKHSARLEQSIAEQTIEGINSQILKVQDASSIKVRVIVQDVTRKVKCLQLLTTLLESILICRPGCFIQLSHSPVAKTLNVHSIFVQDIHGSDGDSEDGDDVFEIHSETKLEVLEIISYERIQWMSRQSILNPIKLGGFARQEKSLRRILGKLRKTGFKGILVSGPSGCGKTTLIEKVKKHIYDKK